MENNSEKKSWAKEQGDKMKMKLVTSLFENVSKNLPLGVNIIFSKDMDGKQYILFSKEIEFKDGGVVEFKNVQQMEIEELLKMSEK